MWCSALNIGISAPNWLLLELISRILLKATECVWVQVRSSWKLRPAERKNRCLWGGKGAWDDSSVLMETPWWLVSHYGAL